jgi:DNA-binding SARP family transcriptional activator/tetratricopeptide (TPR) repeat protein
VEMLHVSLLGEQSVTGEGTGIRACSSRAVALIAFLVAHAGSPQPRQRIAGLFWPDSTDAQALTNLRRELHHLRQVLGGEPSLAVTSTDLCWRDTATCRVDARVFDIERMAALSAAAAGDSDRILTHAARAIAEYGGDLLPGVYDDWLLGIRSQLERQCVDLCDLAATARARTGDLAGAVDAARRRVQLQPLEELGYRTLMELQAELGDRAGAVSTYHHCASVLERELGVIPGSATRMAFDRLMTAPQAAQATVVTVQAPIGRSGLAAVQLVGRAGELAQLRDLWRAAVAGSPGLVLVSGGSGVGKTRLVSEVAAMARVQGALVASTQCFGTSARPALTPVADWLRNPAVQAATATLDPAWRAEVGRLVPSGGHGGRRASSRAMADAWQRHRFFEGLARALLAVGRPLLLVLDNLQWCDHATLEFLTFCLGLAPDARVLVAATLRDDNLQQDAELADWIVRMRATGLLTELPLSPLEAAETTHLAQAVSGQPLPEADAQVLYATTGGFPLYVIEAVRSTVDLHSSLVPAGDLTTVLRKRLAQATAAAREVAGLAAAVGTNFTLDLLTEASDLDADVVVEAVDELWRRRIMREFGDGYDFTHDLLRETAYAQVSPPKRWLLHRRLAQGLELVHIDDTDAVAALLAEQYSRGGRPKRALAYYQRAADLAASMFAQAEAIRLHEEALAIVGSLPAGKDRDRHELAVLEAMAAPLNARYGYSSPAVQQTLERSISLADSLGVKASTITGLVALWASRFVQGRIADGYQVATRALALVDPASELSGQAQFAVGGSAVSLGMPAEGLRHLELAAKTASDAVWLSIGTRADVHSTAWAAHAHWLLGHDDDALSACRQAIKLARAIDHPYCLAVALAYGSITHQMRRDLPALRDTVRELRELCDQYGFAYYREWALILDSWSRADQSGISLARRGIDNLKSQGSFARMPYWLSLLADLSARGNHAEAAIATLDAALVAGRARDDLWWLPEVMRMRAGYDDDKAAVSRLRSAAGMASAHGSAALVRRCERDLAQRGVRLPAAGVPPTA